MTVDEEKVLSKYTSRDLHRHWKQEWKRYSIFEKVFFRFGKVKKIRSFIMVFKILRRMFALCARIIPESHFTDMAALQPMPVYFLDLVE